MLIPNSSPERPQPAAFAAAEGRRAPPPQSEPLALALDRRQLAVELERQAAEAVVGDEQVRARADHADRQPLAVGPGEQLDQRLLGRRAGRTSRRRRRCGPWSAAPAG